jgi:hypothetical protein
MRKLALFLLGVLFAATAAAGALYDNTNPAQDILNDLVFSAGPYDGIGDSIVLTGSGVANIAEVQFFNDGAAGTFDASLEFFQAGAPVGTPIGSAFNVTGISIGSNAELNVAFQLGAFTVPANLVFLVQIANVAAGVDPGLELYSDPTLAGSNLADTAVVLQGSLFSQQATGGGNPFFQLSQTPEPSTWLLAGVGLAFTAARLWRRRAGSAA